MTQDPDDINALIYGTATIPGGEPTPFVAWPGHYYELENLPASQPIFYRLYGFRGVRTDTVLRFQSLDDGARRFLCLKAALENSHSSEKSAILPAAELSKLKVAFWTQNEHPNSPTTRYCPQSASATRNLITLSLLNEFGNIRGYVNPEIREKPRPILNSFIQVISNEGVSVFARVPPSVFRLTFVSAGRTGVDNIDTVLPMIWSDPAGVMAYGVFLASKFSEAAREVGERAALSVASTDAQGDLKVLVAAQWSARFGAPRRIKEEIRKRLRDLRGTDALALDWVLSLDFPLEDDLTHHTSKVLQTIKHNPPLFSETLNLIADRIEWTMIRLEKMNAWNDRHERGFEWFLRLADATYWQCPLTTYRALEPLAPDSASSFESESKKKIPL